MVISHLLSEVVNIFGTHPTFYLGHQMIDVRFSVRYHGGMKSCSITALRSNAYAIIGAVEISGEEVLLTSKGKAIAKVVPLDDEGTLKPAFVREIKRRMKEEKSVPAEDVFKRLW